VYRWRGWTFKDYPTAKSERPKLQNKLLPAVFYGVACLEASSPLPGVSAPLNSFASSAIWQPHFLTAAERKPIGGTPITDGYTAEWVRVSMSLMQRTLGKVTLEAAVLVMCDTITLD
jgi:hypothetical protein